MTEANELETFLSTRPAEVRTLALAARALILDLFPDAVEMFDEPARLIGYGTSRTYRGLVCGITLQRNYVNLMFAHGAELPDPSGLLQGTGKAARHVKLRQVVDVDDPALRTFLVAALALHRAAQG